MKIAHILFSATICLSLNFLNLTYASEQEAKFLETVAEQYILAQFPNLSDDEKITVKANPVNPNKNYGGKCEGYLTAELSSDKLKPVSMVKINCSRKDNPYTLYVRVNITKKIVSLVASRNLDRNSFISSNDLQEIYIDARDRDDGSISNKKFLLGAKLKRNIKEGQGIKNSDICSVCKDDRVTIRLNNKSLTLKTSGFALEDGNINDNIKVKNAKSNKIIYGKVTDIGEVTINMN